MDTTAGITRSCVLVTLTLRQWTGRKKDKSVTDQVIKDNNAQSKKAGSFNKYLLADCKELDAISKFISAARKRHLELTLPWQDGGARLLPVAQLVRYQQWADEVEREFTNLVSNFLTKYNVLISGAAFAIGDMFDRDEYPDVDLLKHRFSFELVYDPVPMQGDFRIDIDTETKNDLVAQHEIKVRDRLAEATRDMFARTKELLERMVDRLAVDAEGKKNTFRDSMLESAQELVEQLDSLNPTNNPDLQAIRDRLHAAINGIDSDMLRKVDVIREGTRNRLADLLDTYDW